MNKELREKIEGKSLNKFTRLLKKFGYAFAGLKTAINGHTSFVTHIFIAFLIALLSIFFQIRATELMFVISAIFLVLITELINTAIEESINLYTKEFNRGAMISKDAAAAAVLLSTVYALMIGVIVFAPKIYALIKFHQVI